MQCLMLHTYAHVHVEFAHMHTYAHMPVNGRKGAMQSLLPSTCVHAQKKAAKDGCISIYAALRL